MSLLNAAENVYLVIKCKMPNYIICFTMMLKIM